MTTKTLFAQIVEPVAALIFNMMRTRLLASVASSIIAVSLLAPTAVQAKCAMPRFKAVVLTTRDTKLPVDGGILVGWQADYDGGMDRDKDPSEQPTWTTTAGKTKVPLTRVSIAPGLSVYRPSVAKPPKGALLLADGKTKLGSFTIDAKAAINKLSAPDIASVSLFETRQHRWSDKQTNVAFKVAPPAEAVAIVMYGKAGAKDTNAQDTSTVNYIPFAFVRIPDTHDKMTVVNMVADTGHCTALPIGTRQPEVNDQVAFAWVDAFGRVSPMSAPVVAKVGVPAGRK